ncbi:hypothetical protein KC332_g17090 [Hortaea werneckii]|uniref:Extracellular membrane protein CFEM domain-containing protein n=1 Tax=Hortaea werneckii TaxID=91943 RepID=A0A3M7I0Q0_HORWE|nr:hypothetical protein KC350_g18674 [Hortaea werneckii]KAI6818257.1 hypothetical protein KC342_g14599 [Hortaea werneckii]KAI6958133.1 hypothetical protein KC329_g17773 [Hortaea werneckii]KAI7008690.1 hypothetical protein KC366_g17661 [Hortaea werneckii]KAI7055585.1 hypothetical protein KC327_g17579 [Hortaea werneckii]
MWALQLLSLPSFALAVSLVDFQPGYPQKKMSSACRRVYTQQLAQCSASDWTQQNACSKECINYLNDLTDDVISACSNQGIEGQNIIVAYLNRDGATSLCGNGKEVLNAGGSSSATDAQSASLQSQTTMQTSAMSTSETTLKATTRADTTTDTKPTSTSSTKSASLASTESSTTNSVQSSTTSSLSSSVTQATSIASNSVMTAAPIASSNSSPSSSLGLNFDTSAPPSQASLGPAPTASTSSSSAVNGQYDNDNSGGGSPFDTQGNMGNAGNGIRIPPSVAIFLVPLAVGWM